MSLRDNIKFMKQTADYQEEASSDEVKDLNDEMSGKPKPKEDDPFSSKPEDDGEESSVDKPEIPKVKIILGTVGFLVLCIVLFIVFKGMNKDKGADFLQEMEEEPPFSYSQEERELLRLNGFTADDIERYEIEERDANSLVEEAYAARQEQYNNEILPYLDGASEQFKSLQALTWVGTGQMKNTILNNLADEETGDMPYQLMYGNYNCDYVKIPAYGQQLFLKLTVKELNATCFMTVTSERYSSLDDNGNIVVSIDFNQYTDGSVLITDISEVDIR